jgi:hypothetical protein
MDYATITMIVEDIWESDMDTVAEFLGTTVSDLESAFDAIDVEGGEAYESLLVLTSLTELETFADDYSYTIYDIINLLNENDVAYVDAEEFIE